MSQIDFGWIFDGFTMNLRFGIGEKSRGIVEPLFSPIPKGDVRPGFIKTSHDFVPRFARHEIVASHK